MLENLGNSAGVDGRSLRRACIVKNIGRFREGKRAGYGRMSLAIRGLKRAVGRVYSELRCAAKATKELIHDVLSLNWKAGSVIDYVNRNAILVQDLASVPSDLRGAARASTLFRVLAEGRLHGDAISLLLRQDSGRQR